ncbi:MAG: hypothetical protein ACRDKD_06625 [Solirubrobacteraceae bacterium]
MSSAVDPAVEDPVGLMVSLVGAIVDDLGAEQIRDVVAGVAGGRAKSRRLAAALRARPAVLCDGRSPAPRGVADLLIDLRKAGASSISPPRCADCDKELRTYQRRGEDWYCAVCGPRLEACFSCANRRRVATRDRGGGARCARCPDVDPRDPIAVICAQVSALQPDASREVIATAVREVAPRPAHRQRLAWALEDNPALLSGEGHLAPVPAVLRLIEALLARGVTGVVRPTCGRCQRVVRIAKALDGQRVCRSCIAKSRAERCVGCGAIREPATRDEQGRPVCPACLVNDPTNLETCVNCGRRRTVSTRSPHGPLCPTCPPLAVLACSVCHESAPCGMSRVTAAPLCVACQRRQARCASCGGIGQVCSGTLDEPRCEACTVPAFRADCSACHRRRRVGGCPACRVERRLRELLGRPDGTSCIALRPLQASLASSDSPAAVLRWLTRPVVSTFLSDVAGGRRPLTHQALDALPQSPIVAHLRAVLVSTGALPGRDEHMARLERLLDDLLAGRDPAERQLLQRYALWHLLPRLRRRNNGSDATYEQLTAVRQQVRSSVALLDWLSGEHLDLATCRQGDLDRWLARPGAVNHHHPGSFIRWATRQGACDLSFPAIRWQGPTGALNDGARWDAARRLLGDDTLDTRDRVAGLLVVLYAQKTTAISRLTTDHLQITDGVVRIRLGTAPIVLPDQLADVAQKLATERHGHASTGAGVPSPWLFPGGRPGRPISAEHLRQRLKALGIPPRQTRSTALFQLATELPAALLARLLGIDIASAIAWQRASSGDWMTYAANVTRRSQPHDRP